MPVRAIVDGHSEALASEDRGTPFFTLPATAWRPSDLPRGYRDPDLTQASSPRTLNVHTSRDPVATPSMDLSYMSR
jgi:hypothetical protein